MVHLFRCFGSIESPLFTALVSHVSMQVNGRDRENHYSAPGYSELASLHQRFLTSSDSREPSPDTITGILAPESHPQSLRDLSALHVYRDLRSDLTFRLGLTLRLTRRIRYISFRIYFLDHFWPVSAAKLKLLMRL